MRIAEADITPSFSLGIAMFPSDGATVESLIAESDAALYTAKKRGKNCFSFADEKLAAATQGSTLEHRDLSGLRRLAVSCLALSLILCAWLFLWEIYSTDYGFRLPWLQVEAAPILALPRSS